MPIWNHVARAASLSLRHLASKPTLQRTPEPAAVMTGKQSISQYTDARSTSHSAIYATCLDLMHRVCTTRGGRALELGAGTGYVMRLVSETMDCREATGVELSKSMLERAREELHASKSQTAFHLLENDMVNLDRLPSSTYDQVYSVEAFHHLCSLESVAHVLRESERVCTESGVVFVCDLVRPKTAILATGLVEWLGEDYRRKNLLAHYEDFLNSVLASWTVDELRSAVPRCTERNWYHLKSPGLSLHQYLIGIPKRQTTLFLNASITGALKQKYVPREYHALTRLASWGMTADLVVAR